MLNPADPLFLGGGNGDSLNIGQTDNNSIPVLCDGASYATSKTRFVDSDWDNIVSALNGLYGLALL